MSAATGLAVRGGWATGALSVAALPERRDDPEWHTLRLFGLGRHPGAFAAGAETRVDL